MVNDDEWLWLISYKLDFHLAINRLACWKIPANTVTGKLDIQPFLDNHHLSHTIIITHNIHLFPTISHLFSSQFYYRPTKSHDIPFACE
jgi:hypothetical protein